MKTRAGVRECVNAGAMLLALAGGLRAQTRALVVTGLGAEPKYQQQFRSLGARLTTALSTKHGIPAANIAWV